MSSPRSRMLGLAFAVVLAGLVVAAGARRTLPQISGTVHIPGLHGQATVVRDRWGVPYIYANDVHDLFVAQGYVTAQDRLWQMLVRRQAAHGQLSEWLGTHATLADAVLGKQDFPAQVASTPPDLLRDAYALGVDACIRTCPEPPELTLLKLQGQVTQVAPWTATDSLALSKMMQWAQAQSSDVGLRSDLSFRVGADRAIALWPESDEPAGLALPTDLAVRQALRLIGIPLFRGDVVASAPGLPTAWYIATLHSERVAIAGATWPGLPGVIVDRNTSIPTSLSGHGDESASVLVKHLVALPPEGWLQIRVHGMLRQWQIPVWGWDGDLSNETHWGNASAAVYQVWVWHLARDVFQDELGPELYSRYWLSGLAPQALARLAEVPDDLWWDNPTTPQRETRDDTMRRAYAGALDDLGRHYGDLHTIWEWDTMHAPIFRHPLGDAWPLSWLNRQVKLGGDAPFDPAHPDDPLWPYASVLVPSLRIKRGTNGQTMFALAGGQSENPFSSHYADLLSLWTRGTDVKLQDAARPLDDVEGVLSLTP